MLLLLFFKHRLIIKIMLNTHNYSGLSYHVKTHTNTQCIKTITAISYSMLVGSSILPRRWRGLGKAIVAVIQ